MCSPSFSGRCSSIYCLPRARQDACLLKNENYLHFRIYRNLAATHGEHENDRLHEYADGFMATMSGGGRVLSGELCPEYVLVTDTVVFVIMGKASAQLLGLADETRFRMQKNEMLIRADDARKESHFQIKQMMLRPEWEALPNDRRTGDPRNGATSHRRGALRRPVTAVKVRLRDGPPERALAGNSTDGNGMPSWMIISPTDDCTGLISHQFAEMAPWTFSRNS